jgi:hypothetical protein
MKEQFGAFTMAAKRARIDAARDEGHGVASVLAFLYAAVAGGLAPSTPAMGIGVTLNTSERSQRFRSLFATQILVHVDVQTWIAINCANPWWARLMRIRTLQEGDNFLFRRILQVN